MNHDEKLSYKSFFMNEIADVPIAHIQAASPISQNISQNNSMTNAYIVAATIWGEARGEGTEGMQAVLNVIMNRAKGNFNNASAISTQKLHKSSNYQFSLWNGSTNIADISLKLATKQREITILISNKQKYMNDISKLRKDKSEEGKDKLKEAIEKLKIINKNLLDNKMYNSAIELVDKAMHHSLPDITDGATVYINPEYANEKFIAAVNSKMTNTVSIGQHAFYKPLPKIKK